MTNQIPPENTISSDEISAAFAQSFAPSIGLLTFQKLDLERQNQSLKDRLAEVEEMAFVLRQDNARSVQEQVNLESENFKLKAEITELENHTQEIEAELAEYQAFTKSTSMSPEAAAIAAEGSAIIANEKAAPVEAA